MKKKNFALVRGLPRKSKSVQVGVRKENWIARPVFLLEMIWLKFLFTNCSSIEHFDIKIEVSVRF